MNENLRVVGLGTESLDYSDDYWDQTDSAIKDERTFDELVDRTQWFSYLSLVRFSEYKAHTGSSTAFTFSFGENACCLVLRGCMGQEKVKKKDIFKSGSEKDS